MTQPYGAAFPLPSLSTLVITVTGIGRIFLNICGLSSISLSEFVGSTRGRESTSGRFQKGQHFLQVFALMAGLLLHTV